MRKALQLKNEQIKKIQEKLEHASSIVLFKHSKMNVAKLDELRYELTKIDAEMKVFKNTLLKRALMKNPAEGLSKHLNGPIVLAFSKKNIAELSKKIYLFLEEFTNQKLVAGFFEGVVYDDKEIQSLAMLPSREELLSRMVELMQTPLLNLVQILKIKANSTKN